MFHRRILFILILCLHVNESSASWLDVWNNVKDAAKMVVGAAKYGVKVITKNDKDWHCGSDTVLFSHTLGYAYASACSSEVKEKINQQCYIHDNCYEDLLGQTNCDEQFCEGMIKARDSVKGERCSAPEKFCTSVQTHGKNAYGKGKPAGFYEEIEAQLEEGIDFKLGITLLDFNGYKIYD